MEPIPAKSPGDKLFSSEWNSASFELQNAIVDTLIVLAAGDVTQLSKSISNYVASGDFYSDTGAADAYDIMPIASKKAPTSLADGLRVRFIPLNSNTGASTIDVAALGTKDIKKYGGGTTLEIGDIVAARIVELAYISSLGVFELTSIENPIIIESIPLFMSVVGMELSPNTTNPLTDIDFQPGTFKNTTSSDAFTSTSVLVKQLDNTWAAGTNMGGRASAATYVLNKWYHSFAIAKPDGIVDFGFDDDINAANLLVDATDYTFFRRIGSIKTELASTDIIPFFNKVSIYSGKREFYWIGTPADSIFSVTDPANLTPFNFVALTPLGLEVRAQMTVWNSTLAPVGGGDINTSFISPSQGTVFLPVLFGVVGGGAHITTIQYNDIERYTNTLSELIYEMDRAGGTITGVALHARTNGWIE